MKILTQLRALRRFWQLILVLAVGLFALRLLPDSVVRVGPEPADSPTYLRESAPHRQQHPVAEQGPAVAVGQRFSSLDELSRAQELRGYVRIGTFGQNWPGTVMELLSRDDAISFTRKDGTRHNYTGFDGYRLQLVRLAGAGQAEVLVVFRSTAKR